MSTRTWDLLKWDRLNLIAVLSHDFPNLHLKSGGVSNVIKVILVKSDPKVKWHVATNNKDNKRHYLTD